MNRQLKRLVLPLYYSALPYANYLINVRRHGEFSRRYIPREVQIETTSICNASCIMCPQDKLTRPKHHMPMDTFTKVIDECAEFEGRGLRITLHKDGDPMLDRLLFDRIDYIRDKLKKSLVVFNTNAFAMDESKQTRLLESPPDVLQFSVDGASKETYEPIRVGLDYDVVKGNIEAFLDKRKAKRQSNGNSTRPQVFIQMVADKSNVHEAETFREMWQDKVDRVLIKGMHNFRVQGTSMHGPELSETQLHRCIYPFNTMIIYSNGEVGLCCWDYDNEVTLGNIQTRSLLDVYNSDTFKKFRQAQIRMDCKDLELCSGCSQIYGRDNRFEQAEL